jgi:RNase P/RNase MRP subunit POP5
MKSLKPTMREKKRYLLVEGQELRGSIPKSILEFIGVLGMSKTGLEFIKENKDSAIISINREMINQVRASFAVWPKKIEVRKVSGTLKGLKG